MKNSLSKYDVIIVGAGPAGLFTAYKIITEKPNTLISIIEKGKSLEKRKCPAIEKKTNCVKCDICSIMSGAAGAGAFSDCKFPITNDFGGTLWEKIGKEKSLKLQREIDEINRELYYKNMGVEGESLISSFEYNYPEKAFPKLYSSKSSMYKRICTQHNLHLLDADIRHLGTDKGQIIYGQLCKILLEKNVQFFFEEEVASIEKVAEEGVEKYFHLKTTKSNGLKDCRDLYSKHVVIAAGRVGSKWVSKLCGDLKIPTLANKVDIGIRFECPNEIWKHVTDELYESKIVYRTKTYEDEVRTFCMNPSGYVVTENSDGLVTVNGHAFEDKNKKSENTNFALLVSQSFTEPFNDSNAYGKAIIQLSNMLGGGVIVQRLGDLIRGKRSTKNRILHNSVTPTLNAEPGDLSLVLPKRILDDIIEMIEQLDHLVPGMKNDDNLLFGVEFKMYSMAVQTNKRFEAENYRGLYFIGDGAGVTHSLSQASANGLQLGEYIAEEL